MNEDRPDNKTTQFLGLWFNWEKAGIRWEESWPNGRKVEVSILGWGDYYVHRTSSDGKKDSYRVSWKTSDRKYLVDQFIAQNFVTIPDKPAELTRDEPTSTITLRNTKGKSCDVTRSPSSRNERFDLLADLLRALADRYTEGKLILPKFEPWQVALVSAGVVTLGLLPYGFIYFVSRPLVAAWWPARPGWFVIIMTGLWAAVPLMLVVLRGHERRRGRFPRLFDANFALILIAIVQGTLLFELPVIGWTAALARWGTPAAATIESITIAEVEEGVVSLTQRATIEFSMKVSNAGRVENRLRLSTGDAVDLEVGDELTVKYFRPEGRWIMAEQEIVDLSHPLFVAAAVMGSLLLLGGMAAVGRPIVEAIDPRL